MNLTLHLVYRTGRGGGWRAMSTLTQVTEARLALGRRLAILRHDAGFTQAHATHRLGYSRSCVARAEATRVCSRDFCRLAGALYRAGAELAAEHDLIEALAAAACSQAARQAGRARLGTTRRRGSPPARGRPR